MAAGAAMPTGESVGLSNNPWEESLRPRAGGSRRSHGRGAGVGLDHEQEQEHEHAGGTPLHHRLSFDHASGVIMLPDDDDWLMEEPDSDEDVTFGGTVGNTDGEGGSRGGGGSGGGDHGDGDGVRELSMGSGSGGEPASPMTPSRASRYGTYFHHPERRRQQIPGAFPRP